ncbi:MAG: hypothetical protein J5747_04740 [Spirochaetaceae bacterium]|nr:hypothetical protein [Spirochaetaceae bacterium]
MSDFWKRVDAELDYLGKNRTYLANKCEFSLTNFNLGIKRGSCPSADTAVKIAAALGVSVEYLVTGSNSSANKKKDEETEQLRLYRKHNEIIQKCEHLSPEKEKLLVVIAENFEKDN